MAAFFTDAGFTPELWLPRITRLAELVNSLPYTYVYDFGCGICQLSDYLENKYYFGYDITPYDKSVIQIDFNADPFPEINNGELSDRILVCAGIIEYILDVEKFINTIGNNFNFVIYCYNSEYLCRKYGVRVTSDKHTYKINKFFKQNYPSVEFLDSTFSNTNYIYLCEK